MSEEDAAATKMSAGFRGKKAREEQKQKKDAASKVAAIQRGRQQRKERKEQEAASVAIQSRIRGKKARGRSKAMAGQQRYYTPAEVASHDRADDLWVSFFQFVYDLTPLVASSPGSLVQPLIAAAGTDISHWFDLSTGNVRTYIDPITNMEARARPPSARLAPPDVHPALLGRAVAPALRVPGP